MVQRWGAGQEGTRNTEGLFKSKPSRLFLDYIGYTQSGKTNPRCNCIPGRAGRRACVNGTYKYPPCVSAAPVED